MLHCGPALPAGDMWWAAPLPRGCDAHRGRAPDPMAHEPLLCNEAHLGLGRDSVGSLCSAGAEGGPDASVHHPPQQPSARRDQTCVPGAHAGPRGSPGAWNRAGSKARRRTFLSILVLFEWVFKAEKFEDRTESSQIAGFSPLVRQEGARGRGRLVCPGSG